MIKAKKITFSIQVEVPVDSYLLDTIQYRIDKGFNPFKSDIKDLENHFKFIEDRYTKKFQHLTDVFNNMDWMDPSVGYLDFDISLRIKDVPVEEKELV